MSAGWWESLTGRKAITLMHKAFDLGITRF